MTLLPRPVEPLPAHPADYFEMLTHLKQTTHALLDAVVREESGVRAGDGCWYDGNPITALICELVEVHVGNGQPWSGALRKTGGRWKHEPETGRTWDEGAFA